MSQVGSLSSSGSGPTPPAIQSGFSAYLSTNQSIPAVASGTPPETTIIFNTELFDLNSEYNSTTGVFTSINAGYYDFSCTITVSNRGTLNGSVAPKITLVTTSGTYILHQARLCSAWNNGTIYTGYGVTLSQVVKMNASDTAFIQVAVLNIGAPADTFAAIGTASPYSTIFSCKLLN